MYDTCEYIPGDYCELSTPDIYCELVRIGNSITLCVNTRNDKAIRDLLGTARKEYPEGSIDHIITGNVPELRANVLFLGRGAHPEPRTHRYHYESPSAAGAYLDRAAIALQKIFKATPATPATSTTNSSFLESMLKI